MEISAKRTPYLFPPQLSSNGKWENSKSTFIHNMKLPVHGWFRYSAGFSAEWAKNLVEELQSSRGEIVVLDPFAGVGTAVIAGEEAGANSYGLEAHPFIARVANSKLLW
ncbi:MAG: DNA methyltransferase, partial [Desulfobacca sp.]|nr:DNA methyltransferase [Desulfobacca sp.]